MKIANKTDHTIALRFFNQYRELPAGWGLTKNEVGDEDTLLFIAFKYPDEIGIYDDDGKELEFIHCPLCGNLTKIASSPEIEVIKEEVVKEIEQPIEAKAKVKVKRVKKSK